MLTGCNLDENVEEAKGKLTENFGTLPRYEELQQETLTWEQARERVLKNNLELRKARNEIEVAQDNVKRVFLNLIPLVNLGYYYNEALTGNNQNYYSEKYDYNINIIFNIPALTRLPIDHYAAEMALFRAEKLLEQKEREILSQLYKITREAELSSRMDALERQALPLQNREARLEELDRRREVDLRTEWMTLAALLADASKKWVIDPETVNEINPERYAECSRQIDPLVLTLMALELEASRLQQLGIKMNYWPQVSMSFYSPSLFNYSGGNNQGFNGRGNDLRVQLDFYVSLDTRLSNYYALKEAKANHLILEEALKMQMAERREKMSLLMRSLQEFPKWRKAMLGYDDFLNRRGEVDAETLLLRRQESSALHVEILSQERANIEREAALIFEYGFRED